MNSSETFELEVQGVTWGGFHSEYIYQLTAEQAESIKALKDAKKFCGDFESISHVAIIKIKTEIREHLINEFGELK